MAKSINRLITGAVILASVTLSGFFIYKDEVVRLLDPQTADAEPALIPTPVYKNTAEVPEFMDIVVPFSTQAPFGDWNQPWQDACEEDAVLMSVAWARGFDITQQFAADEILKQIDFENRALGYYKDTNVADTALLFKDFYHYNNIKVLDSGVTVDAIKKELQYGNLVIVPLAGALLNNPYFTSPPLYHMVVIRGYDDAAKEFITNEPGTKHGNAFRYSFENLVGAIHDWTGSPKTIFEGKKAMIVVMPPGRYR